jgi:Putative peptidoglycan binding domain
VHSEAIRAGRSGVHLDDETDGRPGFLERLGWSARDAVGFVVAVVGSVAILANVLFMHSGPHPAPMFQRVPLATASTDTKNVAAPVVPRARPAEALPAKTDPAPVAHGPGKPAKATGTGSSTRLSAAPVRQDPIAELIAPSKRVLAVQRALSDYGYGQIKPTGILDSETQAAIEKFERARKLPVTGQASERVAKELAAVAGRPLD